MPGPTKSKAPRLVLCHLLDTISTIPYIPRVVVVVVTEEFERWYGSLDAEEQESVAFAVGLLEAQGLTLGHPYSSAIKGSRIGLRELRKSHQGRPYRAFYVFDPKRQAVLLVGGDKTGRKRFYEEMIPKAEAAYKKYLREIEEENE